MSSKIKYFEAYTGEELAALLNNFANEQTVHNTQTHVTKIMDGSFLARVHCAYVYYYEKKPAVTLSSAKPLGLKV